MEDRGPKLLNGRYWADLSLEERDAVIRWIRNKFIPAFAKLIEEVKRLQEEQNEAKKSTPGQDRGPDS